MAEEKEDKHSREDNSKQFLSTQTRAQVRMRAKENLKKAQKVLAESGQQLLKNQKSDSPVQEQGKSGDHI